MLPLFVEAGDSRAAEANNGFDAVLPFDQGVIAIAAVKGADGGVGLGRHEGLTAADGFRIARAVQGEDVPKTVDLAEPDGIGDVGADGGNQGVRVAIKHGFAGNTGLEVLGIGALKTGKPGLKEWRTGFPIGKHGIVCRADGESENDLCLVRGKFHAEALDT